MTNKKSTKLIFSKPLIEGLIKSRPNRFIFEVLINNKTIKVHCPSTGRIGNIKFENIPCFLSASENPARKTPYTAEAISLDLPAKKNKQWIGINQVKANSYIEFFLKTGQLSKMFFSSQIIKREVKLKNSRIDFLINDVDYLEVKTPLKDMPTIGHPNYLGKHQPLTEFNRLIKHLQDISQSIGSKSRALFLMCYLYDSPAFQVPPVVKAEQRIVRAAKQAFNRGMENWQINLKIDKTGVSLRDYFKLKLF